MVEACPFGWLCAARIKSGLRFHVTSCTLLAHIVLPPVLTDAGTSGLLAQTGPPPVLTDAACSTLLALTMLPSMLTSLV